MPAPQGAAELLPGDDLRLIRALIAEHASWNRTRLSKHLCELWNWRNAEGRWKDMACRSLLLKLHRAGHIALPPPQKSANNHLRNHSIRHVSHRTAPIESTLQQRMPVRVEVAHAGQARALFESLLSEYHYLGYQGIVGENMSYLVSDRQGQRLACVLFGSAAWTVAARDAFIGWTEPARRRGLHRITNNMSSPPSSSMSSTSSPAPVDMRLATPCPTGSCRARDTR